MSKVPPGAPTGSKLPTPSTSRPSPLPPGPASSSSGKTPPTTSSTAKTPPALSGTPTGAQVSPKPASSASPTARGPSPAAATSKSTAVAAAAPSVGRLPTPTGGPVIPPSYAAAKKLPPPSPSASAVAAGSTPTTGTAGSRASPPRAMAGKSSPAPTTAAPVAKGTPPRAPSSTARAGSKGRAATPSGKAAGKDPTSSLSPEEVKTITERAYLEVLESVYKTVAPDRVSSLPEVLMNHMGEEVEMCAAMEDKYKLPKGSLQTNIQAAIKAKKEALVKEKEEEARRAAAEGEEGVEGGAAGGGTAAVPTTSDSSSVGNKKGVKGKNASPSRAAGAEADATLVLSEALPKKLVLQTIKDFFREEQQLARINDVEAELERYEGNENAYFVLLENEFGKPPRFFRRRLQVATEAAARALTSQRSEEKMKRAVGLASAAAMWKKVQTAQQKRLQLERLYTAQERELIRHDQKRQRIRRTYTFREQLAYLCDKYCPERLLLLDDVLEQYRNNEIELFRQLHQWYGIPNSAAYLPEEADAYVPQSDTGHDLVALRSIPDALKPAEELARFFGFGPHLIPQLLARFGPNSEKQIMLEVLTMAFPDAIPAALQSDEQRNAFALRRICHFLSFHSYTKGKENLDKLLQPYIEKGFGLSRALTDLVLRYYEPLIDAAEYRSVRPSDFATTMPTTGLLSKAEAASTPQRPDSAGASAHQTPAAVAVEFAQRRREFRNMTEEWFAEYGDQPASSADPTQLSGSQTPVTSGPPSTLPTATQSSNGSAVTAPAKGNPLSRSTPRNLNALLATRNVGNRECNVGTSSEDLPKPIIDAGVNTYHREIEEARLLALRHTAMNTDPFNFEVPSYRQICDRERGLRSVPEGLTELRLHRQRDMYGDYGGAKLLLPNPMIFLEDEDCSKCKVMEEKVTALTNKISAMREEQLLKEKQRMFDHMMSSNTSAASSAAAPAPSNASLFHSGRLLSRQRDGVASAVSSPFTECHSCDEYKQQLALLTARLHTIRNHHTYANSGHGLLTSPHHKSRGPDELQAPLQRTDVRGKPLESELEPSLWVERMKAKQRRDVAVMTDMDARHIEDMRTYFLLDEL